MRKNLGIVFFLAIAAALMFNCPILAKDFEVAPDFKLQDLYQDIFQLSDYKDKQPLLLFFWTTWCPFCQNELRVLNGMYAGFLKDGVELLSVNVGELPDTVESFTNTYHLSYRVLLDRDTNMSRAYGASGVPAYILIDKKGRIIFKGNYFPQKEYKDLISGNYE